MPASHQPPPTVTNHLRCFVSALCALQSHTIGTFEAANSGRGECVRTSASALQGPSFDAFFMACGLYMDACVLKDSRPENSIPKGASTRRVVAPGVLFRTPSLFSTETVKNFACPAQNPPPKNRKTSFWVPSHGPLGAPLHLPAPLENGWLHSKLH